jgi:signal peptidase I
MHVRESAKETADSIIVAFILAFVFRAFIVEAFVIPTGSMAATLYGKHGTITCVNCGWEFAYGLADQSEVAIARQGGRAIHPQDRAICQNCGYPNTDLPFSDVSGARGNAESGDRILVLKWPFDLGVKDLGPQRWDVTVFKNPTNGTQNFIKRLVGLPGEVLEVIDGDVYAVPAESLTDGARKVLEMQLAEKRAVQAGSPAAAPAVAATIWFSAASPWMISPRTTSVPGATGRRRSFPTCSSDWCWCRAGVGGRWSCGSSSSRIRSWR